MIKLVKGLFHNETQSKNELCEFIKNTDQLSIGPQCAAFEIAFARYQERQHCVLFNSGSSANLALIQALLNLERLRADDQAGFSAITWATNVMPLIQLNLKPVPIDVEINTLNISSHTVNDVLTNNPGLKVLFVTNVLGLCGDLDRIAKQCAERGIILLEDNCESLGTVYRGKKLGNWSLASTFSFFVGHHMSTIEGGAVCTDDQALDRMLRLVRAHGWDRNLSDTAKRRIRQEHNIENSFFANFTFYTLGYNLRPTEITGFLGNQQLQYLDTIVTQRHQNFIKFQEATRDNPDLIPLQTEHIELVSNFAMPVIGRSPEITQRYIELFRANNIEIRPIVGGSIPEQPFYKKLVGPAIVNNAQFINHHGFYFGNNPELTAAELKLLSDLLKTSIDNSAQDSEAPAPNQKTAVSVQTRKV